MLSILVKEKCAVRGLVTIRSDDRYNGGDRDLWFRISFKSIK